MEILKKLGITLFVDGRRFSEDTDPCVGRPICVNCEQAFSDGVQFQGNGAICQGCLDAVRKSLFQIITAQRLKDGGEMK